MRDSFAKLDPRVQVQNPVMFLVWLSAAMTSILAIASIFGVQDAGVPTYYVIAIAVILWLTDLFSNFAEALAEGRGKAQADSLRAAKKDVEAHRIESVEDKDRFTVVPGTELSRGDLVVVRAGEQIPGDGDVIEGAASVDESAITGESAPVVREAGGDRSAVTGGTTVLSDWIVVKITSEPGQSFLDKMIAMVEGSRPQEDPQRGRARDLSGCSVRHLHPRDARTVLLLEFLCRAQRYGEPHRCDHARCLARLSGAHHHWCAAVRHWHRRHEPTERGQRAGHVRPRHRGRRRRRHSHAR